MELIDAYTKVIGRCPNSLDDTLKFLELISRVCYKSEKKITDTSAEPFIKNTIVKPGHTAMLEHSCRAFCVPRCGNDIKDIFPSSLIKNPWIYIDEEEDDVIYVVASYRAWMNYFLEHSPDYISQDPWEVFTTIDERIEELDHQYKMQMTFVRNEDLPRRLQFVTAMFKCGRDVSHELIRHRRLVGIAQESQRYVDYLGGIQFIKPAWYNCKGDDADRQWREACSIAEAYYNYLRSKGLSRQEARVVLPNSTATEIYLTAPMFQWDWMRHLRTSSAAYPQMRSLMTDLCNNMDKMYA